ncbi:MAG: hypothetical protein NC200_03955 [Candidatus Gastranaerophilales bacterium]|nr:hypothetical protein [Candidatus Gastranaerophilales bacterium]
MKKKEEEKPSYIKLFIGAFLMMIVFFVIVATHLTSSVDTTIGENDEGDIKESGLGVKHLIDSRLRFIQMEDAGKLQTKSDKDKPANIEQYNKEIQQVQETGYKGKLENSYGYNDTQQTQPYSHTYNSSSASSSPASNTSNYANKTYTVPTPSTQLRTNTSAPTPSPSHQIQKNLTPTGLN